MAVYSPKKHSSSGEESVLFPIESIDKLSDTLDHTLSQSNLSFIDNFNATWGDVYDAITNDGLDPSKINCVSIVTADVGTYLLWLQFAPIGEGTSLHGMIYAYSIDGQRSYVDYITSSYYDKTLVSTIWHSLSTTINYEVNNAISSVNDSLDTKQSITDNTLNTSAKTIVGAINEVRTTANNALAAASGGSGSGSGISDIDTLDLAVDYSGSINNISFDNEGIYYAGQYQMKDSSDEILSLGYLENNIPIVAGTGISFMTTEDSAISINATGSSTAMPTIKLLTVRDRLNTNVFSDLNVFVFTFEISNPELLEDGDTIQICARKRGWKYNIPDVNSTDIKVKTYKYRLRNYYETKVMTQEIADTYNVNPNVTFQRSYENPTRAILRFNVPCTVNSVNNLLLKSHHAHKSPLTNIYFRLCRKQNADNAALHSNVVSIQKYTYHDETNDVCIIHFNY